MTWLTPWWPPWYQENKAQGFDRYFWPRAASKSSNHAWFAVKHSNSKRKGLMGKYKDVSMPFQMIPLDLIGQLPRSIKLNIWLFVVTDWVTKMTLLFPLRQATAWWLHNYIFYDQSTFVFILNNVLLWPFTFYFNISFHYRSACNFASLYWFMCYRILID